MTDAIKNWIIGITGAAMITAAAMIMTPEGRVKKIVSLVCGLVTILALIRPLAGFDVGSFSKYAAKYTSDAQAVQAAAAEADEKLTRRIIEEKCAAYILDKGHSIGMTDLEAAVTSEKGGDGNWHPKSADLKTNAGKQERKELEESIVTELGIPAGELNWSMRDEK